MQDKFLFLAPARHPWEGFADYQRRRREAKTAVKRYRLGVYWWVSKPLEQQYYALAMVVSPRVGRTYRRAQAAPMDRLGDKKVD